MKGELYVLGVPTAKVQKHLVQKLFDINYWFQCAAIAAKE
jgi:hypothetical protein